MYKLESPNVQEASLDAKITVVTKSSNVTERDIEFNLSEA